MTLRSDFVNTTIANDDHPEHHNALAEAVNDLTDQVASLGGGATRTTAAYVTASLALGGTETGVLTLAKAYRLLRIQTSSAARVRLYSNLAKQAADLGRSVYADPPPNAGVVLDYVTTAAFGTSTPADLSPLVDGANTETSPSSSIPITVTAVAGGVVTVTLTYAPTEN